MKLKQTLFTLLLLLIPLLTVHSQTVTYPVEVVGATLTTDTRTVTVPDVTGITRLWMKVHNLSYDGKMSVRVNSGTWFTPENANTEVADPEYRYGGIGGAWDVIRIEVPLSGFTDGSNTIEWRFNGTDGLSSGFRVLDWKFMTSDSTEVPFTETMVEDDPDLWTPFTTHVDSLSEGATLFTTGTITTPLGNPSSVSCADCHSNGGEDLKYFNMSNNSIVQRSIQHGLTVSQGRNIASWIRNLDLPNPGRVWNPPFQPGPGQDLVTPEDWSAGTGLTYVLDTDQQMKDYLFPDGINDNGWIDTDSLLNMRELPTNMMMPDWFNWLPRVHPIDSWGTTFTNSPAWDEYINEWPSLISLGSSVYLAKSRIPRQFEGMNSAVDDFREDTPPESGWTDKDQADANLSLQLWNITKHWEIMRQLELEGLVSTFYPTSKEKYSWFGQDRGIFNTAPHISGVGGQSNSYDGFIEAKYRSAQWYHLQIIVNNGNCDPLTIKPVDWKYTYGHTTDITNNGGGPVGSLLISEFVKGMEVMDCANSVGERGWYARHVNPYWWRQLNDEGLTQTIHFDGWSDVDLNNLRTTMFRSFMEANVSYPVSSWERGDDNHMLEEDDYITSPDSSWGSSIRFDYASSLHTLLQLSDVRGVPTTAIDSLARWAEEAWPLNNFEEFFITTTYGDVSGNGSVTSFDASQILQYNSGLITLTGEQLIAADVSGNGSVSSYDASLVLQFIAELITCFPVENGC